MGTAGLNRLRLRDAPGAERDTADREGYPPSGFPARDLIGATLAILAALGLAASAEAAPISPTDDLPASSAVAHTISRPAGQTWFYTGGGYDVEDPTKMLAARNDGFLERYQVNTDGSGNVTGAGLLGYIDTGISGLQDLVPTPDGYIGVAQTTIYFMDKDFNHTGSIDLTTSDLWDAHVYTTLDDAANVSGLDWALLVATDSDGVRRINDMAGNHVKVATGRSYSIGGMDLDEDLYTNDLFVTNGEYFRNMANSGVPEGSSLFVNMNNDQVPSGDIYGRDFFALTEWDRINLHNPLSVQDGQIHVPEPGSLAIVGLGGLALALSKKKGSLLYTPKD